MTKKKLIILLLLLSLISLLVGYEFLQDANNRGTEEVADTQNKTDRTINDLERRISSNYEDITLYFQLSDVYFQKVRETADLALYTRIDELMDQVETKGPENADIFATRAQVAAGKHDFVKALELGQKAVELNPTKPSYLGIVGDAQIELGKYEEAVESIQKMMDLKPSYSSFARTAYLREIYGDIDGAKEMLEKAISAGSPYPENIAASLVDLGKLQFRTDVEQATLTFNQALSVYSDFPPALAGLGRVSFAKEDYKGAIEYFEKALQILPIAQYATDVGDVYSKIGETEKAKLYYTLALTAYKKAESSGVNTDLETALFLADHDMDLSQALEKAQAVYKIRPDNIYVADTLAWVLNKSGKPKEAKTYSVQALRLGEFDPLILFHAGVIAGKNNNPEEAKRLLAKTRTLHPYFSMQYASLLSVL
ncbi:tetratricopeptide repeat protein [Candidatus Roizmanbacteria bacterium]|nr:tetratricopeptide repeat protein [Candidatus Roizmanbacteria bacterium]